MKNKPLIYIAGKYTDINCHRIRENKLLAQDAAKELMKLGWAVFIPHVHYEGLGLNYDQIMEQCNEIINRCDAIFMLSNWKKSKGANIELVEARSIGLPVFCQSEGYPTLQEYYATFPDL